jgi:hypothetical protein
VWVVVMVVVLVVAVESAGWEDLTLSSAPPGLGLGMRLWAGVLAVLLGRELMLLDAVLSLSLLAPFEPELLLDLARWFKDESMLGRWWWWRRWWWD